MKSGTVNGLIAVLLAIVLGVSMLPIIGDAVNNYDIRETTETFTAEEDDATEETFTLENEPEEVLTVEVEGEELDSEEYTVEGSDVTLDDTASTTDDEVVITYEYQYDAGTAVDSMVNLLPVIFVVILIAGAVAYIRFR